MYVDDDLIKECFLLLTEESTYKAPNELLADDYYSLLKVKRNASKEDILKSFRQKAKTTHPDLFPFGSIQKFKAERAFKKLIKAKDTLLDFSKREKYDIELEIYQDTCLSYLSALYR